MLRSAISKRLPCGMGDKSGKLAWPSRRVVPMGSRSISDLYKVLGVSETATQQEIRKTFLKKAMKIHPDINKSPQAQKDFLQVSTAYEILKDKDKREKYDELLRSSRMPTEDGVGGEEGVGHDDLDQFVVDQFNKRRRKRVVPHETFMDWYSSQFEGSFAEMRAGGAETIEIIEEVTEDGTKNYRFKQKKQKVVVEEPVEDKKTPENLGIIQTWISKFLQAKYFRERILSNRIFYYIHELYQSKFYEQLVEFNMREQYRSNIMDSEQDDDYDPFPPPFDIPHLPFLGTDLFITTRAFLIETHGGIALTSGTGEYLGGVVVGDGELGEMAMTFKFSEASVTIGRGFIGFTDDGDGVVKVKDSNDGFVYLLREERYYRPMYLLDRLGAYISTNFSVIRTCGENEEIIAHYSISPFSRTIRFMAVDGDQICTAFREDVYTGLPSYPYTFKWRIEVKEYAQIDPIIYLFAITNEIVSLRNSIFPFFKKICRSLFRNKLLVPISHPNITA